MTNLKEKDFLERINRTFVQYDNKKTYMYFTKNESIGFKNFDQCYKNWWMGASKDKSIDLA